MIIYTDRKSVFLIRQKKLMLFFWIEYNLMSHQINLNWLLSFRWIQRNVWKILSNIEMLWNSFVVGRSKFGNEISKIIVFVYIKIFIIYIIDVWIEVQQIYRNKQNSISYKYFNTSNLSTETNHNFTSFIKILNVLSRYQLFIQA